MQRPQPTSLHTKHERKLQLPPVPDLKNLLVRASKQDVQKETTTDPTIQNSQLQLNQSLANDINLGLHEKILQAIVKICTEEKLLEYDFRKLKKNSFLNEYSSRDILKTMQKTNSLFEIDMNGYPKMYPKVTISIKVKFFRFI